MDEETMKATMGKRYYEWIAGIQISCYTLFSLMVAVVIPVQVVWSLFSVKALSYSDQQLVPTAPPTSHGTGVVWQAPMGGDNRDMIEKLSKVYSPWPTNSNNDDFSWCPRPVVQAASFHHNNIVHPNFPHTGLIYVKNDNIASASSTMGAGVTLQIAHNVAKRKFYSDSSSTRTTSSYGDSSNRNNGMAAPRCPSEIRHHYSYDIRNDPTQSFLWTTVRHQYKKSRTQVDLLATTTNNDPQKALRPEHHNDTATTAEEEAVIVDWMDRYVMSQYNFMAVEERMSESMVVLKYLLGVDWQDVVVLLPSQQSSSSSSGSTWWFLDNRHNSPSSSTRTTPRCVPSAIQRPFTTTPPVIDEYLASSASTGGGGGFVEQGRGNWDFYLYAAANRSLDRTIDALGRPRIEQGVQHLKRLQTVAKDKCLSRAYFPCSPNGTVQIEASVQSCYAEHLGCGYSCVHAVLADDFLKYHAAVGA